MNGENCKTVAGPLVVVIVGFHGFHVKFILFLFLLGIFWHRCCIVRWLAGCARLDRRYRRCRWVAPSAAKRGSVPVRSATEWTAQWSRIDRHARGYRSRSTRRRWFAASTIVVTVFWFFGCCLQIGRFVLASDAGPLVTSGKSKKWIRPSDNSANTSPSLLSPNITNERHYVCLLVWLDARNNNSVSSVEFDWAGVSRCIVFVVVSHTVKK